jgi:hypothetical protein
VRGLSGIGAELVLVFSLVHGCVVVPGWWAVIGRGALASLSFPDVLLAPRFLMFPRVWRAVALRMRGCAYSSSRGSRFVASCFTSGDGVPASPSHTAIYLVPCCNRQPPSTVLDDLMKHTGSL